MLPLLLLIMPLAVGAQDVELVYRLKFDDGFKGDRTAAATKALEVVRKRVGEDGTVRPDGPDRLVVRALFEKAQALKTRIARRGELKLLAVAEGSVQADYAAGGPVPEGFEA